MSMYQRVLKALCALLVAYAGCLAIAGLALIGVAVAGTSLDLQIDGAAVTGAEAIALCAAAGAIFLVVGLLDVIVAILGLRGVRRPRGSQALYRMRFDHSGSQCCQYGVQRGHGCAFG